MIKIVYFCYLVNNWKEIVIEQLDRLVSSGLYDVADEIYAIINVDNDDLKNEFFELVKGYIKLKIEAHPNTSSAEYPGLKKVREIGLNNESKVLYFHGKGVFNVYKKIGGDELSEEKIKNNKSWRECMEYFCIDRWKECLSLLTEYDNVGVSCNNGWYWGNFFWTQTKHLAKTSVVNHGGSRWDYEAWLNRGIKDSKNFEWYHFTFCGHATYFHPDWYRGDLNLKGQKIIIHKATYGTPNFEQDEGFGGTVLGVNVDVTEIVKKELEKQNFKKIKIEVNNQTFEGDPIYNSKKVVSIEFSPELYPDKIYKISGREYYTLEFEF